jgi:O-antigen/teichoic acid export membrane protein
MDHAGLKKYAANTSWVMAEKLLRMFVGLFVGIWIARYLGPEQFGLLSYAQSFVFLFVTIATLGLDGIVVRELVKDETKRDVLIGTAFYLKLIGAFVILPILAVAVQLTSNDSMTNLIVFVIASSAIFQSFNVIDFYFQANVLSRYVTFANTISLGLSSVIKIALIIHDAPLIAFAAMFVFEAVVLALGLVWFYKTSRGLKLIHWKFNAGVASQLLKDSWPLILSGVLVSIYMKVDQIMIKEMMDSYSVGQYAAAVKISEAWYFIPMALCNSLFPALLNARKQNEKLYYDRLQRLYTLMVWFGISVSIPVTILSPWLIDLLYGQDYYLASQVLVVHIWAGVFAFLGMAFGKYLAAENLTKKSFYRTSLGALLNIILNIILIPRYGITGAAYATLIAQLFANYLYDYMDLDLRARIRLKNRALLPFYLLKNKH